MRFLKNIQSVRFYLSIHKMVWKVFLYTFAFTGEKTPKNVSLRKSAQMKENPLFPVKDI